MSKSFIEKVLIDNVSQNELNDFISTCHNVIKIFKTHEIKDWITISIQDDKMTYVTIMYVNSQLCGNLWNMEDKQKYWMIYFCPLFHDCRSTWNNVVCYNINMCGILDFDNDKVFALSRELSTFYDNDAKQILLFDKDLTSLPENMYTHHDVMLLNGHADLFVEMNIDLITCVAQWLSTYNEHICLKKLPTVVLNVVKKQANILNTHLYL